MKYYIICYIDYKNKDLISIKDQYLNKNDAINNLERIAIEFIKECEGKHQANKCKVDKDPTSFVSDMAYKEGMYIRCMDETIVVYEKVSTMSNGIMWNSRETKVNKIGLFTISEWNIDDALFRCNCPRVENVTKIIPVNLSNEKGTYMDELRKLIGEGDADGSHIRATLKPASRRKLKPLKTENVSNKFNLKKNNTSADNGTQFTVIKNVISQQDLDEIDMLLKSLEDYTDENINLLCKEKLD